MFKWLTSFTYGIEDKAAEIDTIYRLACKYYENVVSKEAILANVTKDDHILCIGGGICPFSAILFHQRTGAKVTVIDNNESCIPRARSVIERLGLDEYVHVCHQDGACCDISLSDYSVVHIALQVDPIDSVFSSIESQIAPGTKLLVRRPKKVLSATSSKLQERLMSCCAYVNHNTRNIGATFLYVKQPA